MVKGHVDQTGWGRFRRVASAPSSEARGWTAAFLLPTSRSRPTICLLRWRRRLSPTNGEDNIISLEATVPAAPGGGSGKLVFEDQSAKTPNAVVVKAIARASIWFEQLATGKSRSMAEIAVRENITDNYVSNLIHLAWLSPDIVDRVLEGDPAATALARGAMLTRKSEALWKGT